MRCIFLSLILVFSSLAAAHADDRLPIPDDAAQKEAAALVQEVFGQEIENTKTVDQKLALTKKLLEQASSADSNPGARYTLLKAALDNAPDALVATPIVDEIAEHFQIDVLRRKASTVWRFSKQARTSSQHKAVAESALQLVDDSIRQDAYDPATKLAEIALRAAQKARDGKLVRETRTKTMEVKKNKADFDRVRDAMEVLEKSPTDATANLTVGVYKCLVKGDWESGVPMLALGDDELLKKLAIGELKAPTTSDEQVALADGWYDLAQKSGETIKELMIQRAGFWYQLSLKADPALSGLVKAKVDRRLATLSNPNTATELPENATKAGLISLDDWTLGPDTTLTVDQAVSVSDKGVLSSKVEHVYLFTKESYLNFVLTFECRFPPGGKISRQGGAIWARAAPGGFSNNIEVQIAPGSSGDFWVGKRAHLDTPKELVNKKFPANRMRLKSAIERVQTEWNQLSITCKGPDIAVKLNEVLVNLGKNASRRTEGPIAFVWQGTEIEFRNIKIVRTK